jgi:hypothetical protein
LQISHYQPFEKAAWDEFVTHSKNGTFLFYRDYLEYHKQRFEDASLIIRNRNNDILALFPANVSAKRIISHQGLTFGGLIIDSGMKMPQMITVFAALLTFYKQQGINELIYKTVPSIYHKYPAEEDRYALYICKAKLVVRSIFTVIDLHHRIPMQERRLRGVKKARAANIAVKQSEKFAEYWHLLEDLLKTSHQTKPVHSLAEIMNLTALFPEHIKLYAAFKDGDMIAGVLIYENNHVARAQYIAANDQGKKTGALDLLFHNLINDVYAQKRFFDFASSDKLASSKINSGLIEQKEGFGGRAIAFDQYAIDLTVWQRDDCLKVLS